MGVSSHFASISFSIYICVSSTFIINESLLRKEYNNALHGTYGGIWPRSMRNKVGPDHVAKLEEVERELQEFSISRTGRSKRSTAGDDTCSAQRTQYLTKIPDDLAFPFSFKDSAAFSTMSLIWTGDDGKVLLVCLTHEVLNPFTNDRHVRPAQLWRSTDSGKTFTKFDQDATPLVKSTLGLLKHPLDTTKVYLTAWIGNGGDSTKTHLHVSTDRGATFKKVELDFVVLRDTSLYWSTLDGKRGFLVGSTESPGTNLYYTDNWGLPDSWKEGPKNIVRVEWSTRPGEAEIIYFTTDNTLLSNGHQVHTLKQFNTATGEIKTLKNEVYNFEVFDHFLYASVHHDGVSRRIEVTSDNKVWNSVQLPTLAPDQFISLLAIDENQVFVHVAVDARGGKGTLYISTDEDGVLFTESLADHFYPNDLHASDFYKVESMRGVYLTGQLMSGQLIRSVISFNRGATWQLISPPPRSSCPMKVCSLQIHNRYSINQHLPVEAPMSQPKASGILMAHATIADALEQKTPDVFISDDGGYEWTKSLTGPHQYRIADHGGLLVAWSKAAGAHVLKYSIDAGQCWNEQDFSPYNMTVTGLLTEPGSKTLQVSVWGYADIDDSEKNADEPTPKQWMVVTLDFSKIVPKKCESSDYEEFVPHKSVKHSLNEPDEVVGCLLGERETIKRVKKGSWCHNGDDFITEISKETCPCTKQDYTCSFGYEREVDSNNCVEMKFLRDKELRVCKNGHLQEIETAGYHKLPGDKCNESKKNWEPSKEKHVNLEVKCSLKDKTLETVDGYSPDHWKEEEEYEPQRRVPTKSGSSSSRAVTAGVLSVLAILTVIIVLLVIRYRNRRRNNEEHSGLVGSYDNVGRNATFHDNPAADPIDPPAYTESDVEMLA